mgnify:CR=1 FL=1
MVSYLKNYWKSVFFLFFVFLFLYFLNIFFPLYADDYVYMYVWDGSDGWNMLQYPLKENAQRVDSFSDIAKSLWSHYFTWGGRIPAHVLVQFFLWQGEWLFNFLNALVFIFLMLEIYWFSLGGRITFQLKAGRLAWIFFGIWACCPELSESTLWLTGSCNYLWMFPVLLTFLLPYVRDYFSIGKMPEKAAPFMLIFGILAGWTNENTVSSVILLLAIYGYFLYREKKLQAWMICGEVGLWIGYAFMLLAPGNFARKLVEARPFNLEELCCNFMIWAIILGIQFVLWYSVRVFWAKGEKSEENKKLLNYVTAFLFLSLFSVSIMLLSPSFPLRSAFGSTIFLLIAVMSMVEWTDWRANVRIEARRFFAGFAVLYMAVTMATTLYGYYRTHLYVEEIIAGVQAAVSEGRTNETIHLKVRRGYSETLRQISVCHFARVEWAKDKNANINTNVSFHWGIDSLEIEAIEE